MRNGLHVGTREVRHCERGNQEEGQRVLAARPRVTAEAMAHAWELPPHTFGGAYAEFMGRRSFSPDDRPPPRFRACPDEAFVAQRAREVHDFWHELYLFHKTERYAYIYIDVSPAIYLFIITILYLKL